MNHPLQSQFSQQGSPSKSFWGSPSKSPRGSPTKSPSGSPRKSSLPDSTWLADQGMVRSFQNSFTSDVGLKQWKIKETCVTLFVYFLCAFCRVFSVFRLFCFGLLQRRIVKHPFQISWGAPQIFPLSIFTVSTPERKSIEDIALGSS